MADTRINALTATATTVATDDYVAIDGTTNGTRKILGSAFVNSVTGTANQVTVSPTTGAVVVSLPTTITNVNSITAQTTTDFAINGGSSGASLTLNQGTNGNVISLPTGTGAFVSGSTTSENIGFTTHFQVLNTTGATSGLLARYTNNANGARWALAKSRSGAIGTKTTVVTGDNLGRLSWYGDNGTSWIEAATIYSEVASSPTATIVPARIVFAPCSTAGGLVVIGTIDETGLTVAATTTSTSSTTGSLVANGGVGVAGAINAGGAISDLIGNVRSIPQNSQTGAYALAVTDNGKHISITTGGVTVNSGIFSAGQVVVIFNNSASSQTITQGTSVTMYLGGAGTTGNRTLAGYGVATVMCVASNTFVITGSGLT